MNNIKDKIIDIDGYVHIVNNKVICFEPDVYDLNNPDDVEALVKLSHEMFVSLMYPAIYGEKNTMVHLENYPDGDLKIVSLGCIDGLEDELKRKVRFVLNEFEKV